MSQRRAALGLGAGAVLVGWWFGAVPVAVSGIGIALAGLAAWGFEAVAGRRVELDRTVAVTLLEEGEPLVYEVRPRRWLLPGAYVLRDRLGPLELPPVRLRTSGTTTVSLGEAPRGRHLLGPGRVAVSDLLGLARVEREVGPGPVVLVRPRVPDLDSLFTDGGGVGGGGRRAAVPRASGSEFRGVREYRDGEALRAVHWASTARRGQLMVRDLEEPPQEEMAVVLDLDASSVAGPPGRSSLDAAVRAAGAVARAELRAGRAPLLVLAGDEPTVLRLAAQERDWALALDALAAAAPATNGCALTVLAGQPSPLSVARQVVLVSARARGPLLEALERRAAGIAVVAVDAPSFAGGRSDAEPALLRLAARRVPVAVVRAGDDLREVLSARRTTGEAASG